jgi:hypothetical protein
MTTEGMGPLEREIDSLLRLRVGSHPSATEALVEGQSRPALEQRLEIHWRYMEALAQAIKLVARRLDDDRRLDDREQGS